MIFEAWVSELRRVCLQRRKSVVRTKESGYTLWRSPTAEQPGVDVTKLREKDGSVPRGVGQRLYLNGIHRNVGLPQQVRLWLAFLPDRTKSLLGTTYSLIDRTSLPQLNPRFVEWLMGWPIGWTDCGRVETGSCRKQQPTHGKLLLAV